jgi:Cu/Ag efflux pump CusA
MEMINAESQPVPVACRLTSPQLQERKRTVIASLQRQVLESRELPHGYSYRFGGTDETLDELLAFIKTERQCCGFFDFALLVQSDETVWLTLTGPAGARDFINAEVALGRAV